MKLTVTVITLNEAAHIGAALASVAWADEIVVVDAGSADGTVDIARPLATRVHVLDWAGYGAQKNRAAELASHDWILSLDADERVTPNLAREIRATLDHPRSDGYRIPRVTCYLGRWLRTTDWYPDLQLRLYDRRKARWNLRRVHESVEMASPPGRLRHEIQHYAYRDVSHHLSTIDRYTTLAAEQWMADGRRANALEAVVHPPLAFLRNYLLRGGFRDGAPGLLVSVLNSYYVFLKLLKLWERQRQTDVGVVGSRQSGVGGQLRVGGQAGVRGQSEPETDATGQTAAHREQPAAGSGQRAAGGGKRETGSGQRETGNGKREAGSGHREAGSGKREAD